MDTPNDRLDRFIASAGAGMDAAGRTVYTGPLHMYSGPRESAATQQVHANLEADAMRDDPQGNVIRKLLDQLKMQNLPGTARVPVFPLAAGGDQSYTHNER